MTFEPNIFLSLSVFITDAVAFLIMRDVETLCDVTFQIFYHDFYLNLTKYFEKSVTDILRINLW